MDATRPRIGVFLQARSNSSRLPGKVFAPLPGPGDDPAGRGAPALLERCMERLNQVRPDAMVRVLVPENDRAIQRFCRERGLEYVSGPEDDVRERYRQAARELGVDVVVRATGDNPCVDPDVARETVAALLHSEAELLSFGNLPLGLAVEAMTTEALRSELIEPEAMHREHVSLHIKHYPQLYRVEHPEHPAMADSPKSAGALPRLTVDTPADLEVVQNVFRELGADFRLRDILELHAARPELFAANRGVEQRAFARSQSPV